MSHIVYEKKIDVAVERDRLTKELERMEKEMANGERQLGNEQFLAKGPGAGCGWNPQAVGRVANFAREDAESTWSS